MIKYVCNLCGDPALVTNVISGSISIPRNEKNGDSDYIEGRVVIHIKEISVEGKTGNYIHICKSCLVRAIMSVSIT